MNDLRCIVFPFFFSVEHSGGSRNLGRGDPSIKNAREARANF